MNTLKNLKILKSSNLDSITLRYNSNMIQISKNNFVKRNVLSYGKNNLINKNCNLLNVQKINKFFSTINTNKYTSFDVDYENKKDLKEDSSLNINPDMINYSYSLDTYVESSEMSKIINKLNESNLYFLNSRRNKLEEKKENFYLDKNMLYTAFLDINRRFPIKQKYSINQNEDLIKTQFYNIYDIRNDQFSYKSSFNKNEALKKNIENFISFYKLDNFNRFYTSLTEYVDSFESYLKLKTTENYNSLIVDEYINLIIFLKSLFNKKDFRYFSDNIVNINNKAILRIVDVLLIRVTKYYSVLSDFSLDFVKSNENILFDIIYNFKIKNFSREKENFKHYANELNFLKKFNFPDDYMTTNLIPYLSNVITAYNNKLGENSIESAKYYYLLSYLNLKINNIEKTEEYIEKSFKIYNLIKNKIKGDTSQREMIPIQICLLQYYFIKSQIISIYSSNRKESFLILKKASDLIEEIEENYYKAFFTRMDSKNNAILGEFSLENDYTFNILKFKIHQNLGIFYQSYNYVLDMHSNFEKCSRINTIYLKSNRYLMEDYLFIVKSLSNTNNLLNLSRKKYDIAKKNFDLSYYIQDQNNSQNSLNFFADSVIKNINESSDKYNLQNLLNSNSYHLMKNNQKDFIYSLIYIYQKNYDYDVAKILNEYLEILINQYSVSIDEFEKAHYLLMSYERNLNLSTIDYNEAIKNLIELKEILKLDILMNNQLEKKISEKQLSAQKMREELEKKSLEENSEKIIYDQYDTEIYTSSSDEEFEYLFEYNKNEETLNQWIHVGISINYNIIINQIKSNNYDEAITNIDYLLNLIKKLNENKNVGSVIHHAYLSTNLNFLAAHYYLIKNQKIYSVRYLKDINSMITKYEWGSKDKINSYLTEMVKLINNL